MYEHKRIPRFYIQNYTRKNFNRRPRNKQHEKIKQSTTKIFYLQSNYELYTMILFIYN